MSQTVVLKVAMSCGGCAGAVKRVLGNMEGVESFDIDQDQQKVTVKGNVEPEAVLQTVSKTGKKTEFWQTEATTEAALGEPEKPAEAPSEPGKPAEALGEPGKPAEAPGEPEKPAEAPGEPEKPAEAVVVA